MIAGERRTAAWTPAWTPAWLGMWAGCALLLTCVDAVLLMRTQHYFGRARFSADVLDTPAQVGGFLLSSLALDAFAVVLAWGVLLPILKRLPLRPISRWGLAGAGGVVGPLVADFVLWELQRILGDAMDLRLLTTLAGGLPQEMLAQAGPYLLPLVAALVVGGIALLVVLRVLGQRTGAARFDPPGVRRLLATVAVVAVIVGVSLPVLCADGGGMCGALGRKPSGALAALMVQHATDVDRDGFGLMARLRDPAPFDSTIHPYALDLPGNGIDENGLAGDHPQGLRPPPSGPGPARDWKRRPHLLFVLLESFRADLLDSELGGREVTPFLNRLAAEGARLDQAYAHSPYTWVSRAQLLQGRLGPRVGAPTLIDDFRDNGYFVAYFSGQDDSFGGSRELLGLDRVDLFYDARRDRDSRTSRSTTAGSLQVSWKTVVRRVSEFLDGYDFERPLLLYVNLVDNHFPYHHAGLDDILGVEPLPQADIGPEMREELWATYANAAANVDRGVERVVVELRARLGGADHAIVVTADHGESMYERGYLGHGQDLGVAQTRVPLIVWGIGGEWPEPFGLSELRGQIQRNLPERGAGEVPRPRVVQPAGRELFQFGAELVRPRLLAMRRVDSALHYDLLRGELLYEGSDRRLTPEVPEDERARFATLIWTWEALARQSAAAGTTD